MKPILYLLLAGVLLSGPGCATPAPAKAGVTVRRAVGSAEVSRTEDRWTNVRTGQKLGEGMLVRTGPNGSVDLHLGNYGGVLTVHPDSTLALERLGPTDRDPEVAAVLNLTRGRVTGDTLTLPAGMKIVVKTLVGMHEIR